MSDWQTVISDEANSLEIDPLFISSTDLHIDILALCQSKGIAIPGYTTDFDDYIRIDPPDIGADEVPLKLIITPGVNNPVTG